MTLALLLMKQPHWSSVRILAAQRKSLIIDETEAQSLNSTAMRGKTAKFDEMVIRTVKVS